MGDIINDIEQDIKKEYKVDRLKLYKLTVVSLGIVSRRARRGVPFKVSTRDSGSMFIFPGNRLRAYRKVKTSNISRKYAKASKRK